jgi:hypothetical protein
VEYELAERTGGIAHGGIGVVQQLAVHTGLIQRIDEGLRLLQYHRPYHESDHVLNIAFNVLCGGQTLDDIELRRRDPIYLDALDASSIPDPTTAGDFCRRFQAEDIASLMEAINETRLVVWARQGKALTGVPARIDVDGTLVPTTGV